VRSPTVPLALIFVVVSSCDTTSAVTVSTLPGSTKSPYFTFLACRNTMMLWAKSSPRRIVHAAACVIASSMSAPGITGKQGK